MKLLITGATGFVGRNLLLAATQAGSWSEIIACVRDEAKLRRQLEADRCDADRIRVVPWGHFDAIGPVDRAVHCAGVLFARDRETYFRVNVDETLALATVLPPESTRFLVLSSQSAGGPTPAGTDQRTSDHADAPITLYGESKLAMERRLIASRPATAIWRPPMILGPRDGATLPLFQMATGIVQIKPGLSPKTYSWIAVADLVRAILQALESDDWNATTGRPLPAAAPDSITDHELIAAAVRASQRRPRIVPVPLMAVRLLSAVVDTIPALRRRSPSLTRDRAREIFPDRWVIDADEFRRRFLPPPTASLAETLQATHDWLVATGQLSPAGKAA